MFFFIDSTQTHQPSTNKVLRWKPRMIQKSSHHCTIKETSFFNFIIRSKWISHLSGEVSGSLGWVVLRVTSDVSTTQVLDGNVLNVETNIVSGDSLSQSFVVHFYGLDLSGESSWGEGNDHTGLQQTSFDTTDGYRSNTTNLVHVL